VTDSGTGSVPSVHLGRKPDAGVRVGGSTRRGGRVPRLRSVRRRFVRQALVGPDDAGTRDEHDETGDDDGTRGGYTENYCELHRTRGLLDRALFK
jgi:hypothetical protein